MPFRVSEQGDAGHKLILLEDTATGTKAEVYAFGALLNAFSVIHKQAERNIIDGFQNPEDAIQNITCSFKSAKLSPFVCRLKEGQYAFGNSRYKIEKYYYYRDALHGLIYDAVFTIADNGANEESVYVRLTCDYNKTDRGFPFFYRIEVIYQLRANNDLSIATKVTNLSSEAIPMADGWHPYFSFGKKVDQLELFINTHQMVEFDNRLLPTGNLLPYHTFSQSQNIANTKLDNCFLLQQIGLEAACILKDVGEELQLTIYPDANYPYLQIFIPDHRNSIAIENLSSLPDVFNNGIGLMILQPSESAIFNTRFVIQSLPLQS